MLKINKCFVKENESINTKFYWSFQGYRTVNENNGAVSISGNIFLNSQGTNVIGFSCTSFTSTILLNNNIFVDNQVPSVLSSNCPGLSPSENLFQNFESSYDYRISVPYMSTHMNAVRNFWNASSFTDVSARIYANEDDATLAVVDISPWYVDLNKTELGYPQLSFFKSGGLDIGGTLTSDIVLKSQSQAYMVVEDIIIPFGFTLEIEAGVTILFKRGGITVYGRSIL